VDHESWDKVEGTQLNYNNYGHVTRLLRFVILKHVRLSYSLYVEQVREDYTCSSNTWIKFRLGERTDTTFESKPLRSAPRDATRSIFPSSSSTPSSFKTLVEPRANACSLVSRPPLSIAA
jgi:hypothetical protein